MRCEKCGGNGTIGRRIEGVLLMGRNAFGGPILAHELTPCPDCNGSGIANCCEGERPGNALAPEGQK